MTRILRYRRGSRHKDRRGFSLLAVLWIIMSLAVIGSGITIDSNRAVQSLDHAHSRTAARWRAEGCMAHVRSVADRVLQADPSNAMLAWRELDRHAGAYQHAALSSCQITMQTEGRVILERASEETLLQLPGMTQESAAQVMAMRMQGIPITDFVYLHGRLTGTARTMFERHYQEFLRQVATEPDAWIVRIQAYDDVPGTIWNAPATVEARLVRAGARAAIVRWIEW